MRRLAVAILIIVTLVTGGQVFGASRFSAVSEAGDLNGGYRVYMEGGRISIDATDIDIAQILTAIGESAKTDIYVGAGVSGKITVKISAATIEDALKTICQSSALVYEYSPDKKAYLVIRALAVPGSYGKSEQLAETVSSSSGEAVPTKHVEIVGEKSSAKGAATPEIVSSLKNDRKKRPAYKAGELLVKFKEGASPQEIDNLHRRLGSVVIRSITKLRLQRIKLKAGLTETDGELIYQAAGIVEHAERHALRYPEMTPDDPGFFHQWGLEKISAKEIWDITRGRPEVIIAVIDTGVDYKHPDLRDNIWINKAELNGVSGSDDDSNGYKDDIVGWDFADDDNDPTDPAATSLGHGTHVAGIIGAVGNNHEGISGVNWQVSIMPLKVMADGSSELTVAAIIEAIDYAIANGAHVVNCSFGGTEYSVLEQAAFSRLRENGILAACAAGNYSDNMDISGKIYPACYDLDNILSVASTDSTDTLVSSSNYGKNEVDVAAPGNSIYSTLPLSGTTAAVKTVDTSPPAEYPAIGMEYAALTPDAGITGTLYDCGMGYPDQIPHSVSGNIALIERGNLDGTAFYFSEKAINAQARGAAGIIFYNNVVDEFDTLGGTFGYPGVWVPAVSITKELGEALLTIGAGKVTLLNKPSVNPYGYMSGTSMATPHVAGLAALIYSQCRSPLYSEVKTAIMSTVDKIPALADKTVSGGRINAFAALTSMVPPGDLSGDCHIGLEDAVLAMQIISGSTAVLPCPVSRCHIDVNGNNLIGAEEVIYILQKISGIR